MSNVKKIFQSLQEEQVLAELPDDPGPTPKVLFLPVSLECVRLGKFPEAIGYSCLHDTVLEMGSRVVVVGAVTNPRSHGHTADGRRLDSHPKVAVSLLNTPASPVPYGASPQGSDII